MLGSWLKSISRKVIELAATSGRSGLASRYERSGCEPFDKKEKCSTPDNTSKATAAISSARPSRRQIVRSAFAPRMDIVIRNPMQYLGQKETWAYPRYA